MLSSQSKNGGARVDECDRYGIRRRWVGDRTYIYRLFKALKILQRQSEATLSPDSDDSDNEGGLGNVERVVMRPPGIFIFLIFHFHFSHFSQWPPGIFIFLKIQPQHVLGHSGKAKKGHLCFDAIYETGGEVEKKSRKEDIPPSYI